VRDLIDLLRKLAEQVNGFIRGDKGESGASIIFHAATIGAKKTIIS
jgi:hypothetical protein